MYLKEKDLFIEQVFYLCLILRDSVQDPSSSPTPSNKYKK